MVFWPVNNETLTSTSFLLICLAIIDNVMLFFYYLLLGVPYICAFGNTCQYYMKVSSAVGERRAHNFTHAKLISSEYKQVARWCNE